MSPKPGMRLNVSNSRYGPLHVIVDSVDATHATCTVRVGAEAWGPPWGRREGVAKHGDVVRLRICETTFK